MIEALGLPTEVIEHSSDPPNPWAGYKQCLSDLPDCSHILVIQEDALPCVNFGAALKKVAQANPDVPVCLFLGAVPANTAGRARRAMKKGTRYIPLGPTPFVPLVAVLWTKLKAEEFLAWSENVRFTRADDGNVAKWTNRTKQPFNISVPSLVEHNDFIPSVKGGNPSTWGKDKNRVALFLAENGLQYDW